MSVKVLAFGFISDIVRSSEIFLKDIHNTGQLKQYLYREHPQLKKTKIILAVNQRITTKETNLKNGDEIALLAPFAGG